MPGWKVLLRCVAEAVCAKGLKALFGLIPFGEALYDIGEHALGRWREQQSEEQMRLSLQEAVNVPPEEVKAEAATIVQQVAAALPEPLPPAQQLLLASYLTQLPAVARQSLKRPEDLSGKSVPVTLSLRQPDELLPYLPPRLPKFQAGESRPEIHNWVLIDLLGVGGFGEVWLARHPKLSATRAAFKFCLDLNAQQRILPYEAEMINRVQEHGHHPGIVTLLDADLDANPAWLKYEYVPGGDLAGLIHAWKRDGRLLQHGLPALLQLAKIVAHFHQLNPPIVHRDLKPANVLVQHQAEGGLRLRIADFGIGGVAARHQLAGQSPSSLSRGERLISYLRGSHTPLYASPQQKDGKAPDPRDDVHALGVIGYQLLTGCLDQGAGPDFDDDLREAGVAEPVVELLKRCISHKPERRPSDAADLANRLHPLLTTTEKNKDDSGGGGGAGPDLAKIALQKQKERETVHAAARQLEKECRWAEAVTELEKLSPDRRDAHLYQSLQQRQAETVQLDREVGEAAHNDRLTWRHRPTIQRLKELQPFRGRELDGLLALVPEVPRNFTNTLGMPFVLLPAATFWMSENDTNAVRQVAIPEDFYIGVHPVTQGQWQALMGNNPSHFSRNGGGAAQVKGISDADLKMFPVEQVSWEEAQQFIQKMNERERNSGWLYRLPTEAEWEYACRGGAISQEDCSFDFYLDKPTNDLSSTQANFDGNHPAGNAPKGPYLQRTTKVGSYKPNRLGIYDMHGNVWEWCEDLYQAGGSPRLIRGGCWSSVGRYCRAAYRSRFEPADRYGRLGFRLARIPSGG